MIKIFPAIDIIDGKCVRLEKGEFSTKKTYSDSPLDVAKRFEDTGVKNLHLVDLDGARTKKVTNYRVLELLVSKTALDIDFGGGISSDDDLRIVFECGAKQANIGSIAVKEKPLFTGWLEKYQGKIILSADCRDEKIAVSGWEEETRIWIYDFLEEYVEKGVQTVTCTDISKDGLLQGPSLALYKNIAERFPKVKLIASGGVTTLDDVYKLQQLNIYGVIIGKALYEGRIALSDLKKLL